MAIETEVKLRLPDAASARAMLEGLGYRARGPRTLQVDQLYDRAGDELEASGRVLRLRSAGGQCVLTYKGPAGNGPHKSREEIELRVEDGPAMEQILLALGYHAGFRYEKYRTTFRGESDGEPGIVTLDETPMGDFLELEGPEYWIDGTAVKLGFCAQDHVVSTYAELYHEFQQRYPQLPRNMLFSQTGSTSSTKSP